MVVFLLGLWDGGDWGRLNRGQLLVIQALAMVGRRFLWELYRPRYPLG